MKRSRFTDELISNLKVSMDLGRRGLESYPKATPEVAQSTWACIRY